MKTYRGLIALAVGLFFVVNTTGLFATALNCPKCKAPLPSGEKVVTQRVSADIKCSMEGDTIKKGSMVTHLACPACKEKLNLCAKCARAYRKSGVKPVVKSAVKSVPKTK